MNEKNYGVTVNFNEEQIVGQLKLVGLPEDMIGRMIMVPAVIVNEDKSLEVVDWSLIPAENYKPAAKRKPRKAKK